MQTKLQMKTKQQRRVWPAQLVGTGSLALCAAMFFSGAITADERVEELDTTRAALEKWVETRALISKEKRDWEEGRQALNDRIGLVQREIDALNSRTQAARNSIAEADKSRSDLVVESESLKDSSLAFTETVVVLESRTLEIVKRLPEPLVEKIKSLIQRVPTEASPSKLGLSDRFLSIVGILNEVDRFNREISLTSEVRQLQNGTSAEVAVMYVGLGCAYYVTNNGEHAGIGTATEAGWEWKPADDSAAIITKAIAILRNEQGAEYVQLPLQIN